MPLALTDAMMPQLGISVADFVDCLRDAYRELGEGAAKSKLRERLYLECEGSSNERAYFLGTHVGAAPSAGVSVVRLDSMFMCTVETPSGPRTIRDSDFSGTVMVYSLANAELVAIMQDHWISTRRVAATSALGAELLARPDAKVLGLLGTGEQARQHVPALLAVRDLEWIKVFSPNPEHRQALVAELADEIGCPIVAVSSAQEAVEQSDIVVAATSSETPVLEAAWLAPGTHVCSIVGGDGRRPWRELGPDTVGRADVIVINSKAQAEYSNQAKLLEPAAMGILDWTSVIELGAALAGRAELRHDNQQITLHDNNCGMGLQFAAVCGMLLRRARELGIGQPIDDELFVTRGGTYVP